MYDIDEDKILESFVWYVVSKMNDEKIGDMLYQFRDDYRDVILDKLNRDIEIQHGHDKEVEQHKKQQLQKDLDTRLMGFEINIDKWVDDLGFSKDSWKERLGL